MAHDYHGKNMLRCLAEKPISEFYRHPMMGDGYLNKCKECTRSDAKANRITKIEYYRDYDRKRGWRPPPPEKLFARNAARKLQKQPCEVCGETKVEAHHDDYDKPLQVRWLCKKHHAEHHRKSG